MAAELNATISFEFILQTNTRTIGRSKNLSYDFIPAKSEGMRGGGGIPPPLPQFLTTLNPDMVLIPFRCVSLWLTWRKYETMYRLLTCTSRGL